MEGDSVAKRVLVPGPSVLMPYRRAVSRDSLCWAALPDAAFARAASTRCALRCDKRAFAADDTSAFPPGSCAGPVSPRNRAALSAPEVILCAIVDAAPFYEAERYHQEYFAQNPGQPYCMAVVAPKVVKFRKHFTERLKRRA